MALRNKETGEISTNPSITVAPYNHNERGCHVRTYKSIAELLNKWEDYKPAEPLIKDKKIRDIIRPWAKVNGATELKYYEGENCIEDIFRNEIHFNQSLGLEDAKTYTIDELCGEDEE